MTRPTTAAAPAAAAHGRPPRPVREILLVILIAALIVIPRSVLVTRAHSETWDEQYHLLRGLRLLDRSDVPIFYNDAPLGEVILAFPLWAAGATRPIPAAAEVSDHNLDPNVFGAIFYNQKYSPETLRQIIAVWQSLLFLPFVAFVYVWARKLYGRRSAALAVALVLTEPTIAAHLPLATLDVLAMEAALPAAYLAWRFFERPTFARMLPAAVGAAVAMLIKHTNVIFPGIVFLFAVAWYVRTRPRVSLKTRLSSAAAVCLLALLAIWPLTLFDVSRPADVSHTFPTRYDQSTTFNLPLEINDRLVRELPAGVYIGSLAEAYHHGQEGHPSVLLGRQSRSGWYYYYPVVAAYKVPLCVFLIAAMAVWSLRRRPLAFDEVALLVPFAAFALFITLARINIGLRHALAAYAFAIVFISRALAGPSPRWFAPVAWLATVAAFVYSVLAYHPDYIAYLNFPRHKAYNQISDSNVDWGQSLPQIARWLDAHPPPPGKPVYLGYWGRTMPWTIPHYFGTRHVILLGDKDPVPTHGLLIVSPIWEAGLGDPTDALAFLRPVEPVDTIGHTMLVYDLDALGRERAKNQEPRTKQGPMTKHQ